MNETTELMQTARDLAGAMSETFTPAGSETDLMLVHKDFRVEDLEKFLDAPVRIRETVSMGDLSSLSAYVNRFKNADTTLGFALPDRIGAVLADNCKQTDVTLKSHGGRKAAVV